MKQDKDEVVNQPIKSLWPFWGMLEPAESGRLGIPGRPDRIRHYIIFSCVTDVFRRFNSIGNRALELLKGRTIEDLTSAAQEIDTAIDEARNRFVEEETESLIKSLYEHGGYQSLYLPDGSPGTEDDYRELLKNWSGDFGGSSGAPHWRDMSRLDALSDHLGRRENDEVELCHLGLIEPDEQEFYAVLTLMIICDAVHENPAHHYPNPESISQVKAIGHATIEAFEALAYAERIQLYGKIRDSISAGQPAILAAEIRRRDEEREAAHKKRLSSAGAKGAEAKNRKHAELKSWALAEAVGMRDDDATIARKLWNKLPDYLADVSKNPERLIYDALRAKRAAD